VPVIYGRNAVLAALQSGVQLNEIRLAKGSHGKTVDDILKEASTRGVHVAWVTQADIERTTGRASHQGVLAVMDEIPYADLKDVVAASFEQKKWPFFVLLDGVEDPHNLGAVIRSAEVMGCSGVVIPKRRSAGLNATVMKVSAGAASHIPVSQIVNVARTLEWFKRESFWVIGADAEATKSLWEVDFKCPLLIVIGGENRGLSRLTRDRCDVLCRIPMVGKTGSFNVSVAASIFFYEINRQQQFMEKPV